MPQVCKRFGRAIYAVLRTVLKMDLGLFIPLLLFLLSNNVASSQEVAAEQKVLNALRSALLNYQSIELLFSAESKHSGSDGDESGPITEHSEFVYRRADSRGLLSIKSKTDRSGQPSWLMQNEYIFDENGDILGCQAPLDGSFNQIKDVTPDLGLIFYSEQLAGKPLAYKPPMDQMFNDAGAAFWVIGYAPLLTYLDTSKKVDVRLKGEEAFVSANSEYGQVELILSRNHGWLPQSFKIVKSPEHQTHGGRVGDLYKDLGVTSLTWKGDVTEFASDEAGRWSAKRMKVIRVTESRSKPAGMIVTEINVERARFNPSFSKDDFRTSINFPVGYKVTIAEASQLQYKWDGTQPIADVSPLAAIIGVPGAGGSFWRYGLIAINVVFLAVIAFLIRRRLANA